jgi:hypothetical protein
MDRVNNIMANTLLDAESRGSQMGSAKAFYDTQMNLVQQLFSVKLTW